MKQTLFITRPNYDLATSYLYYYAGLVIKFAEEKGVKVIDLVRPRLTLQNFENLIAEQDPSFVFFNAHGNSRSVYGDKIGVREEILVEENKNHALMNDRLIFARACWAAASLGKTCTKDRQGCFIGYKMPFSFFTDEQWSANPAKDGLAKIFLEPSNLIVVALLKSNTAKEAVNKSTEASKKSMLKLLRDKAEPGAVEAIQILWNNVEGLELLGNENMRFD